MSTASTASNTGSAAVPVQDLSRDAAYLPAARRSTAAAVLGRTLNLIGVLAPAQAAARLNAWVWCRPPRYRLRPEDAAALASAVPLNVRFKQRELPTYSWGSGPAVILVHGWGGAAGQMAHLVPALLARGLRVVAFDAPAHGEAEGRQTDFPEITEALRCVALAVGDVHGVVCHSAGSVAALRALRQGLKLNRLAVLSAFSQLQLPLAAMASVLKLSPRVRAAHLSLLQRLYGSRFTQDYSPEHLVQDLAVPGLLVHDQGDREFGAANASRLLARWPVAQLHLTEGLGHYRLLKDPAVAERVAEFMQQPRA